MGCGASQQVSPTEDGNNNSGIKQKPSSTKTKKPKEQKVTSLPPVGPVRKPVSFAIGLNEENGLDIISKHPPKRLRNLEPPSNKPLLTPEMVEQKLKLAEEKRKKNLEEKVKVSKRSSKLRQSILQAKEFEKNQQSQEIENKLQSAEMKRDARQRLLEEKKKIREERARRAQERAKKIKQEENGMDFDLEKDEAFNADDDDSWLDGENNQEPERRQDRDDSAVSMGERIYSGRESPVKGVGSKYEKTRVIGSAGTTDSFDYAFQRDGTTNTQVSTTYHNRQNSKDDFFDS